MEPQESPSFTCWNCSKVNYYNPDNYVGKSRNSERLMEMKTLKDKEVTIRCSNPKCREINTITITYS